MPEVPKINIIRGGRLLDIQAHSTREVDILIEAGAIKEIARPGLEMPQTDSVIDATGKLLMPGLVNAHTHGHGALGKGMGDRWTLELLLNAGPWLSGGRSAEHKYLSAAIGALEMVAKGCTACYDLYFEFPAPTNEGMMAVGQAYADVGMRAVLAPMIADRSFYQAIPGLLDAIPEQQRSRMAGTALAPFEETLATCRTILDRWEFARDQVRPALAPTIPLHCSDEFLVGCRDLAREYGVGLHTHLAESKAQSIAGMNYYGHTLAAHLDELGILGPDFTAAHGVWLDADDIKRLADRGASLAHNPGSNMRLGSGLAPSAEMVEAGLNIGIGTDAASCSDNQNMFEAMRLASFASRVRSHDYADWLETGQVLEMATAGSARVLGFGDDIGRLEVGAKADIVFLDSAHVNYTPLNDVTNQIVHTEDGTGVHAVMVGGRMIYQDGRYLTLDAAGIRDRIAVAVEELRETNAEVRTFAQSLESIVGHFCVGLSREPFHVHSLAGRDH